MALTSVGAQDLDVLRLPATELSGPGIARTRRAACGAHPMRRSALAAGLFYLLTFISIPILALYRQMLDHPDHILGAGSDAGVIIGTILELTVAFASS